MEQVAREAGYAVGSLYTYFPGKQELYHALLQTIGDQIDAVGARPLPPSLTFRQRFETLIVQQLELIEKNRGFVVSFVAQRPELEADRGTDATPFVRDIYRRNIERVAALAAVAMDAGELRRADPRDVAYFVVDVVYGAVVRWATGDLPGSLAGHASVLADLVFKGIGFAEEGRS
jgi:AcrR family transcriptional regulator